MRDLTRAVLVVMVVLSAVAMTGAASASTGSSTAIGSSAEDVTVSSGSSVADTIGPQPNCYTGPDGERCEAP